MRSAIRGLAIAAMAAVIVISMTGTARADMKPNSWELGALLPFVMFDDIDDADLDDNVGVFFRGAYNITSNHEVEFTIGFVSTEASAGSQSVDVEFTNWQFGYIYNFAAGENLVPFVGGGIGRVNTSVDDFDVDEDDTVEFINGGVRWFFNETFGLRFEGGVESVDADPDRLNNMYAGVGVSFNVGG
jgi:hypothetical protein